MRILLGWLLCGVLAVGAFGQQSTSKDAPPALPIPEPVVHPDRTVTFTFKSETAKAVSLTLEGIAKPIPMTRGEGGVWSLTTAPLKPEIYGYTFRVDGQTTLDARNPLIKAGISQTGNGVLVPSITPEPWEVQAVPHGEVHQEFFTTTIVEGLTRDQDQFFIYTPPGYDPRGKQKYPVLYLLHGWGDTAGGWIGIGQANAIFDSLIASGTMKPTIVVMPLGYGFMDFELKGWGEWSQPTEIDRNTALFERSLLTEVKPRVEREYNVATGRENTAIAGLSMGGLEALTVGLNHTDTFAYVGGFSSAVHMLKPENLSALDPKKADLQLLWVACGTEDQLIAPNRKLSAYLKGLGLPLTEIETPGLHTWLVWRDNLTHFAPLLFQK
jgi:enterochelin esterase family protein